MFVWIVCLCGVVGVCYIELFVALLFGDYWCGLVMVGFDWRAGWFVCGLRFGFGCFEFVERFVIWFEGACLRCGFGG